MSGFRNHYVVCGGGVMCVHVYIHECIYVSAHGGQRTTLGIDLFFHLETGLSAVSCCVHHTSWSLSELPGILLPCLSSHCESTGILDVPSSPWNYVCPEALPKVLMLA